MSERDFRAELEAGRCKPNHGCNVCRECMCVLAEEAIDDNDRLRACIAELEAKMQSIHRITSLGSRTLDEMIRDMGYANDVARTVLAKGRTA